MDTDRYPHHNRDNQSAKFSIEVIAIGNKADLQGPREEAESLKA